MSNPIPNIKREMLRALKSANGAPIPGPALDQFVRQTVFPRPLQSDINQARRDLETEEFITGQRDEIDQELFTWSLTDKGKHAASKL